ncbi:MAG TPA: DUF6049 family protein [Nocardioidaceae bacterium]|nr:DUF6049 family protein [Nocardioidaceae bacterium]
MTRNLRRRAAACLTAGLVTLLALPATLPAAGPAVAAEEPPAEGDPLLVSIDTVTPSAIPSQGSGRRSRVRLAGVVTNTTESTWTDLKVYLLSSETPMRSAAELEAADELDPTAYLGDRLAEPGQFISIPDLGPGESTRYSISRPRNELDITGQPGVYWLGVQVLGADENGRVDGADGRARTLVPLMRAKNPPSATLALTLPFRARIAYDDAGRVLTAEEWHTAFGMNGRFGRLLSLSRSAGGFPLSWVLDPALLDLLRDLAADNPGLDIGPTDGESTTPSETAPPDEEGDEEPTEPSPEATAIAAYLDAFLGEAANRDLLALPYGDVDVAGAFAWADSSVVEAALEYSETRLEAAELDSTPVVAPPDGTLPWSALDGLPIEVPVLLDDTAVNATTSRVDVAGGPRITRADTSAVPGAGSALDMRQRILAEVAVRALSRSSSSPVVVSLPDRWDPGVGWQRAQFFAGFDVPWLDAVDTATVLRSTTLESIEPRSDLLRETEATATLPASSFVAARNLRETGHVLDVLLPRNDRIEGVVAGLSYLGISGQFRDVPGRALDRTVDLDRALQGLMDKVTLSGPTFVTMSSENGEFQVTILNDLDEPVLVGVEARVETGEITIPPSEPITIPAGQRRSVRLKASTSRIGVWPVSLEPVNSEGDRISTGEALNVRSSHVGQFVWGSLGVGTLVLLVLIFFRVRRKVRQRQATPGPLLPQDPRSEVTS